MLDEVSKNVDYQDFYASVSSPYAHFEKEMRKGGSFGAGVLCVEQDSFEAIDPPFEQLIVSTVLSHKLEHVRLDFGDGWVEHVPPQTEVLHLQPANQECHLDIGGPHVLLLAGIPWVPLQARLDEVGVRVDPFIQFYGGVLPSKSGHAILRRMWDVMASEDAADALLVDALVISLISEILSVKRTAPTPPPVLDDIRLQRVVDYIEAHLASQILMSELAEIAAMSLAHMPRQFKHATGLSPHAYLTQRRMLRARHMLATTDLAITQIALACGFGSSAHFATTFKAQTGCSPSMYRNEVS